jgi:hypothetical protein
MQNKPLLRNPAATVYAPSQMEVTWIHLIRAYSLSIPSFMEWLGLDVIKGLGFNW